MEEKKRVYLQRQGVSKTVKASVGPLFIEFNEWRSTGLHVAEVVETVPGATPDRPSTSRQLWSSYGKPRPLDTLIEEVGRRFGIEFEPQIEAYCYATRREWELWPCIKGDVFRTLAVYETATDTVRHARTNVCLVAWYGKGAIFDFDAASGPYREICRRAVQEFEKSHNQRNSDVENKSWLAWLIGEWIKDDLGEEPVILESVTR